MPAFNDVRLPHVDVLGSTMAYRAAMVGLCPPNCNAAFGPKELRFFEIAELQASTVGARPVQPLDAAC